MKEGAWHGGQLFLAFPVFYSCFFLSLFCLGWLFHQTPTEKVLNPLPCLC